MDSQKIYSLQLSKSVKYSLHNNLLSDVTLTRKIVPLVFTKEIKPTIKITNQKSSGRCWIFAALNMLRRKVIKDNELPNNFEFSQSYLFFWDR